MKKHVWCWPRGSRKKCRKPGRRRTCAAVLPFPCSEGIAQSIPTILSFSRQMTAIGPLLEKIKLCWALCWVVMGRPINCPMFILRSWAHLVRIQTGRTTAEGIIGSTAVSQVHEATRKKRKKDTHKETRELGWRKGEETTRTKKEEVGGRIRNQTRAAEINPRRIPAVYCRFNSSDSRPWR